jgi:hypothetical protein
VSIRSVASWCLLLGLCCAKLTKADPVTYTDTGNRLAFFQNTSCPPSCSLSGSLTFSAPLPSNESLLSSPGLHSLSLLPTGSLLSDSTDIYSHLFIIRTDGNAFISYRQIDLGTPGGCQIQSHGPGASSVDAGEMNGFSEDQIIVQQMSTTPGNGVSRNLPLSFCWVLVCLQYAVSRRQN